MDPSKVNSRVLAIDPGPVLSAWVLFVDGCVHSFGKDNNERVRGSLVMDKSPHATVIEMVASYGMAVGAEVFETCVWIGRFMERTSLTGKVHTMYRRDVKLHWCGTTKANDSNIRQAVIDHYGGKEKAIGNKRTPGPLYGIKADVWQALALGLAWQAKGATSA